MKMLSRTLAAAALAVAGVSAQATVILTTDSLTGYVQFNEFGTVANTYTITFRDLQGIVSVAPPPAGPVTVSVQGSGGFDLDNDGNFEFQGGVANPLAIFSGLLSVPLSGPETVAFDAGATGVLDTPLQPNVAFVSSYNGAADPGVFGLINGLFGNIFSDPTGAGSLSISADLYSDGAVLRVTETADWFCVPNPNVCLGFGGVLRALDAAQGANTDGQIDGNFFLRDVRVTAVPEPATLALVGLGLLGAAAARRRRT